MIRKAHQYSSNAKNRNITFNLVIDSCGQNYTGKYNFLHNDHGNKPHSVNKKSKQKKNKREVSTCILVVSLMA